MSTAERDQPVSSHITINNRYRVKLDRTIGEGGLALVYEGLDLRYGERIAVKTLKPNYQRDTETRERFRREGRMMGFVRHPNLVERVGLFEEKTGTWLVMEYVDGRNVHQLLRDEGPLDPETVFFLLEQIGEALSAMHRSQIVHLDVKPQNLILQADGTMTLIDFGLAQFADRPQELVGGIAFGTVAYLAPEQARSETVTAATDIYALGCVVYEMLTGCPPFSASGEGQKERIIDQHLNHLPLPASDVRPELQVPDWMDEILDVAMAKDPADRFRSVEDFVAAYAAALDGRPFEQWLPGQDAPEQTDVLWRKPRRPEGTQTLRATSVTQVPMARPRPDIAGPDARRTSFRPPWPRRAHREKREGRRLLGGRVLRRLAPVLIVFAMMLALIGLLQGGRAAVMSRVLSIAPGTSTTVIVPNLNVREEPGADQTLLASLSNGTELEVTGLSRNLEDGRWWPIDVTVQGGTVSGWVWGEGIEVNWWMRQMTRTQGFGDGIGGIVDSVTGLVGAVERQGPYRGSVVTLPQTFLHGSR